MDVDITEVSTDELFSTNTFSAIFIGRLLALSSSTPEALVALPCFYLIINSRTTMVTDVKTIKPEPVTARMILSCRRPSDDSYGWDCCNSQ